MLHYQHQYESNRPIIPEGNNYIDISSGRKSTDVEYEISLLYNKQPGHLQIFLDRPNEDLPGGVGFGS